MGLATVGASLLAAIFRSTPFRLQASYYLSPFDQRSARRVH